LNSIFFKLYDWNKDGAISKEDIDGIIRNKEHTLGPELETEVKL